MSIALGGVTASVVGYALDGLSLRHSAIAANLANANSIGYRPVQVSFEDSLAALVQSGSASTESVAQLPKPRVFESGAVAGLGSENSVEMQTVLLNQNVIQHRALITGLNKYLATLSTAINEGKR